jgi:hypothetical protein
VGRAKVREKDAAGTMLRVLNKAETMTTIGIETDLVKRTVFFEKGDNNNDR